MPCGTGRRRKVELLDELYGAEPAQLLQIIRMAEVTDPARLMLIGHNPGMHELALMLAGSGDAAAKKAIEDNLPTAGLAILDFEIDDWSEVAFRRGKLVRFTSPKLLKQAWTSEAADIPAVMLSVTTRFRANEQVRVKETRRNKGWSPDN